MSEKGPDDKTSAVDLHRILLEIEDEVRAKRASGELPADLERELDLVFARFAPAGAVEGDFDALLQRAEQQSFIDLLAPNESARPGFSQIKRVVQKTVRWYVRYVVEQFGGFAHTITKAVRLLGDRVTHLEQLTPPQEGATAVLRGTSSLLAPWKPQVVEALAGTTGRVLHARCHDGWLVGALRTAGVDAYGVDPSSEFVTVGTAAGLDLRPDDERSHLRTLSPGVLGGLVLSGSVDVLPRGAQIELLELAALTLAKGAPLVILASNPATWGSLPGVPVDLVPGRPIGTETWTYLLSEHGFTGITVKDGSRYRSLSHVPGTDETVAAINSNLDLLNDALFPPVTSMIVASR